MWTSLTSQSFLVSWILDTIHTRRLSLFVVIFPCCKRKDRSFLRFVDSKEVGTGKRTGNVRGRVKRETRRGCVEKDKNCRKQTWQEEPEKCGCLRKVNFVFFSIFAYCCIFLRARVFPMADVTALVEGKVRFFVRTHLTHFRPPYLETSFYIGHFVFNSRFLRTNMDEENVNRTPFSPSMCAEIPVGFPGFISLCYVMFFRLSVGMKRLVLESESGVVDANWK